MKRIQFRSSITNSALSPIIAGESPRVGTNWTDSEGHRHEVTKTATCMGDFFTTVWAKPAPTAEEAAEQQRQQRDADRRAEHAAAIQCAAVADTEAVRDELRLPRSPGPAQHCPDSAIRRELRL